MTMMMRVLNTYWIRPTRTPLWLLKPAVLAAVMFAALKWQNISTLLVWVMMGASFYWWQHERSAPPQTVMSSLERVRCTACDHEQFADLAGDAQRCIGCDKRLRIVSTNDDKPLATVTVKKDKVSPAVVENRVNSEFERHREMRRERQVLRERLKNAQAQHVSSAPFIDPGYELTGRTRPAWDDTWRMLLDAGNEWSSRQEIANIIAPRYGLKPRTIENMIGAALREGHLVGLDRDGKAPTMVKVPREMLRSVA
jgi:hypothetical protein